MRIIPAIDLMDGKVVRLYRGDPEKKTVYSDDPVKVAKEWERDGADMLHVVDLDAALGTGSNVGLVSAVASSVSIPVQVAGGLRSTESAIDAASAADRIVVGTMAFEDKESLGAVSAEIGTDRTVISADHSGGMVVTRGWQSETGVGLLDAVNGFVSDGFSEFLVTDVGRDGTMQGPDLGFLGMLCGVPRARIIASGGISGVRDVQSVLERGAWGVILGRALYEGKLGIREAKGIP